MDSGNRDDFFDKWSQFFTEETIENNYAVQKLQFNLEIYFLIFEIHPVNKNKQKQLNQKKI